MDTKEAKNTKQKSGIYPVSLIQLQSRQVGAIRTHFFSHLFPIPIFQCYKCLFRRLGKPKKMESPLLLQAYMLYNNMYPQKAVYVIWGLHIQHRRYQINNKLLLVEEMTNFEFIVFVFFVDIMKVHIIFETARDQLPKIFSRVPARATRRLCRGRLLKTIG